MPVSVDVKPEYFGTWIGRLNLIEIFLGILCMACSAPAYYATQHWFLLVVVCAFIGSWFFLFYHFVLDTFMKSSAINWLQTEFYFMALTTLLYFTAFVAQLVAFSEWTLVGYQYWVDANIAAGVFGLFNDIAYGLGTYLIYNEWRVNPTLGVSVQSPTV